jgi:general secretion pathway protein M
MNIASLKAWWQGLNLREQRLVIGVGAVCSIFLLYSLIWQPLNDNVANGQTRLESRQALLTWVTENTARYQRAKSSGGVKQSSGSLSSIVNRTAERQQLTITRMQPQGDILLVWLDNVPFAQLLLWLESLANNEGLQVQAIDLSQGDSPGEVRVRRLQLGKQ